jgi:hypothetical protein
MVSWATTLVAVRNLRKPLTLLDATPLVLGVKPFKLRVDWTCWKYYPGEPAEVWLHVLGEDGVEEEPKLLREFDHPPDAAGWARQWMEGRGFAWWCDVDTAQRQGWTHLTLFPFPAPGTRQGGQA